MMERYLRSLTRRHRALDLRIAKVNRQAPGTPMLSQLKRLRLALKDEIARRRRNAQTS